MYAIIKTGGKQYTVKPGEVLDVEKIEGEAGTKVQLEALFINDGTNIITDADALAKATVTAEIIDQHKGKKAIIFKFKKRKGYKRTKGHRQNLTKICITEIAGVKAEAPAKKEAPKAEKPAKKEAPKAEAPKAEEPVVEAAAEAAEAPAQDLSKFTVVQLKEMAKEKGIKIPSGAKKAEIIEIIENA